MKTIILLRRSPLGVLLDAIFLLLLLTVMFPRPAASADLPMAIKAPNKWLSYPTTCGVYYGGAFSGAAGGGTTDGLSGTQVLAGDLGVVLGYTCPLGGSSFLFVENIASVSKINGAQTAAGFALAGAFSFEQRLGIGAPWSVVQQLTAAIPSLGGVAVPSVPTLPGGLSAGPVNPYVFVGLSERDVSASLGVEMGRAWVVAPEIGFGTLTRLSNGMVLDGWVKYQPASSRVGIGLTGQSFRTGDFVGIGMALKL
jgi:hypothetical protein